MTTILALPGEIVPLALVMTDGATVYYPRAIVYDESGVAVGSPIDLTHISGGYYRATFTVPSAQKYQVVYTTYADAGHTIDLSVLREKAEDLIIADMPAPTVAEIADGVWDEPRTAHGVSGSFGEALRVLLGSQAKANFRIDNMTYDINGFLSAARIRVFPDQATAVASTSGGTGEGEIHTISMSGVPDGVFPVQPTTVLGLLP